MVRGHHNKKFYNINFHDFKWISVENLPIKILALYMHINYNLNAINYNLNAIKKLNEHATNKHCTYNNQECVSVLGQGICYK